MLNLELDKVKCSVCDVKSRCIECEKDIINCTLESLKLLLTAKIKEGFSEGLISTEEEIISYVEDVVEGAKDNG